MLARASPRAFLRISSIHPGIIDAASWARHTSVENDQSDASCSQQQTGTHTAAASCRPLHSQAWSQLGSSMSVHAAAAATQLSQPGSTSGMGLAAAGCARSISFWGWGRKKEPAAPPPQLDSQESFVEGQDVPASPPPSITQQDQSELDAPPAADHLPGLPVSEETVSAVHEACDAVEAAALQGAKEESFFAAGWFLEAITALHQQAGLPWWGAIALANVMTRVLTLPVMIMSQQATSRMATINLDVMPLKKMQEAMAKVKTQEQQRVLHAAMLEESGRLSVMHQGTIMSTMLKMFGSMLVNGFVFISIFNGVSSLCTHKAPSLAQGGMLWFNDLTVPDPYYGLPVLCTLTTLAMVEYGINITGENMDAQKAGQARYMKNVFRGFALLFLPFGGFVPSGVALLWVSNSFFSVLMGIALRQDAVRTAVGLPTLKDLSDVSKRLEGLLKSDPLSYVPAAARAPPPPHPGIGMGMGMQPPPPAASPSGVKGSSQSVEEVVNRAATSQQQQQQQQGQDKEHGGDSGCRSS